MMRLTAAVVARGSVIAGDAVGETSIDKGFEGLVHRGQADVGHVTAHGGENLLGRGVSRGGAQVGEHRRPLARETPAGFLQGAAHGRVLDGTRSGFAVRHVHIIYLRWMGRSVKKGSRSRHE